MIFEVEGQRSAEIAVDGCGHCMPPDCERSKAGGNGERSIGCSPRIELDNM